MTAMQQVEVSKSEIVPRGDRVERGRLDLSVAEVLSGTKAWLAVLVLIVALVVGVVAVGIATWLWVVGGERLIASVVAVFGLMFVLAGTRRDNWSATAWVRIAVSRTGIWLMRDHRQSEMLFVPWKYVCDVKVGRATYRYRLVDIVVDPQRLGSSEEFGLVKDDWAQGEDEKGRIVLHMESGAETRGKVVGRLREYHQEAVRAGEAAASLETAPGEDRNVW